MKEFLLSIGIAPTILIGAIVGSVIALKVSKEKLVAKITSFFIGIALTITTCPMVCKWLNVTEDDVKTGVAVIIGYGGIILLDKLLLTTIKKIEKNGDN